MADFRRRKLQEYLMQLNKLNPFRKKIPYRPQPWKPKLTFPIGGFTPSPYQPQPWKPNPNRPPERPIRPPYEPPNKPLNPIDGYKRKVCPTCGRPY